MRRRYDACQVTERSPRKRPYMAHRAALAVEVEEESLPACPAILLALDASEIARQDRANQYRRFAVDESATA